MVMLLLLPGVALADDLEVDLSGSAEYDSNVFRTSSGEDDDVVFRIVPAATLSRREGDFRYRLNYSAPFEQGVHYGDAISDVDQLFNVNSTYLYDDANEIVFRDAFRFDRSLTRRFSQDEDIPDVSNERSRVLRNNASLGWNHAFTARTRSGLEASYNIFRTDLSGRQDVQTLAATGDLTHDLTSRDQVGAGLSFTMQDFGEGQGVPSSQTFFYNLFLSFVHQFDETTTFSIAGGPTLVQDEEDSPATALSAATVPSATVNGVPFVYEFASCGMVNGTPVFAGCNLVQDTGNVRDPTPVAPAFATAPPTQSDLTITAFGRASLTKRWSPAVSSALNYRRQQSTASGLGGSTILDAVSLSTDWQIDQWWDVGIRGDFTHRESTNKSTQTFVVVQNNGGVVQIADGPGNLISQRIDNSIETNRWGVSGRLARQIGRNAEASLRLSWSEQSSARVSRGAASDFDVFLAIFGVRYRFQPLTVW
jgi:hypothetical protein